MLCDDQVFERKGVVLELRLFLWEVVLMTDFKPDDLVIAAGVIVALFGIIAAVWKGVEAWRKLTGKEERKAAFDAQNAAISHLTERVAKCEERLNKGDMMFDNTRNDMTQTLCVLNAMLMHFISGNDHDKLKDVKDDLDRYLMHR